MAREGHRLLCHRQWRQAAHAPGPEDVGTNFQAQAHLSLLIATRRARKTRTKPKRSDTEGDNEASGQRPDRLHRSPTPERFVPDSPLERAGFELPVSAREEGRGDSPSMPRKTNMVTSIVPRTCLTGRLGHPFATKAEADPGSSCGSGRGHSISLLRFPIRRPRRRALATLLGHPDRLRVLFSY